jgi:hypothetical protein
MVLRTLALVQLIENQSAANLKKVIKTVLDKYSVAPKQIYTMTTDNGANMLKCVADMRNDLERETNDPFGIEETIEQVIDGLDYEEALLQSLELLDDSLPANPVIMKGVKCAAHTLQLAVGDAIAATPSLNDVIGKARAVVKQLKTPNIQFLLDAQHEKRAILDVETRYIGELFQFVLVHIIISLGGTRCTI